MYKRLERHLAKAFLTSIKGPKILALFLNDCFLTKRSFKLLNGQKKYMRYRAEKDPARGMLRGFFGNEWTEHYINHILFDLQ